MLCILQLLEPCILHLQSTWWNDTWGYNFLVLAFSHIIASYCSHFIGCRTLLLYIMRIVLSCIIVSFMAWNLSCVSAQSTLAYMLQVPSWITERKLRLKSDTMFHTCNYTRYAGMQLVSTFKSGMIYLNLKCPISMLWHSTYLHLQIGQIRLTIYTLIRSLCQHRTKVSQSRLRLIPPTQAPTNASTTSSLCKLKFFFNPWILWELNQFL